MTAASTSEPWRPRSAGRSSAVHRSKPPTSSCTVSRARGFSDDELVDAGLARRSPSALPGAPPKVIDYYRRRVMVPVRNGEGRVIGLIGRYDGNAKADGAPKYMNPPRTAVYDKAAALYRPSTPRLDPDGQVVVVEGTLDALAVASAAARAGFSSKFAPLCESGIALSDSQVEQVMAIHHRAPVLAADGDTAGGGANTKWAAALAVRGRESAIVAWPDGEDPASWLASHGTAGLIALTRKGCLEASEADLRPRHSAREVAQHILETLPGSADVEDRWRAALAPCGQMRHAAAERYATGAAETLAPAVVAAAIEASTDSRRTGERRDPHRRLLRPEAPRACTGPLRRAGSAGNRESLAQPGRLGAAPDRDRYRRPNLQ